MKCKYCGTELEEGVTLCPECGRNTETAEKSKLRNRILTTVMIGILLVAGIPSFFLLKGRSDDSQDTSQATIKAVPVDDSNLYVTPPLETITVNSPTAAPTAVPNYAVELTRPLPNLFYIKDNRVYYASGEVLKPTIISSYPFSWENLFYLKVSEDGQTLLYPESTDPSKDDFSANLIYSDLTADSIRHLKIDSEVNNFTMNQDGSLIYYLKNKELYVYDLIESKKLADDVNEFYINKEGNRLVYRTSDCNLFLYNSDGEIKKLDANVYLKFASEDLNMIYYFKEDSLYLLKDCKDLLLIDSGLRAVSETIISIYEDGSLYYLKPRQLKDTDYVNDDMVAQDSSLPEPKRSDYPDHKSYSEATEKYREKGTRDNIRERLAISDLPLQETNSLYYYSNGKSTLVSDYCTRVWRYSAEQSLINHYRGNDQPILAYEQLMPNKTNMSSVTSYDDIYNYIINYVADTKEQYVCSGADVLGKFAKGELYLLLYDLKNNKIYYEINYLEHSNRGDLYSVAIDGPSVSEGTLYEEKVIMYDPNSFVIGNSVIYLKNGSSSAEDYILYVDHREIDRKVIGWIYGIKNSDAFIYLNNWDDHNGLGIYTNTLNLYKDGKGIILADNVTGYYAFDEDNIVYVTEDDNKKKQLLQYDGSDTRVLIDSFSATSYVSDIITPLEDYYYCYHRKTFEN